MDKVIFPELRLLIREYVYYHGEYPLISKIYKIYKTKFNYTKDVRNFGRELHLLQKQGNRLGFIPVETTYKYTVKSGKRKGKVVTVKRVVKRIVCR